MQIPEDKLDTTLIFPCGNSLQMNGVFLSMISPVIKMFLERESSSAINMNCAIESWNRIMRCIKRFLHYTRERDRKRMKNSLSVEEICQDFDTLIFYQIQILYEVYANKLISEEYDLEYVLELTRRGVDFGLSLYKESFYNKDMVGKLPGRQFYECYDNTPNAAMLKLWMAENRNNQEEMAGLYEGFKKCPNMDTEIVLDLLIYVPERLREDCINTIKPIYEKRCSDPR